MIKKHLFGVILTALFFSTLNLVNANVVVNEFLPNSVNKDYEWIELYNDDASSVNISGYNISEEKASKNFTIKDIVLEPKSFLVLVWSDEIFNQTYSTAGIKIMEYGDVVASLDLNDGSDSIFLYDSNGQLVDSVKDYANPGENISIGKYPDGYSSISKLLTQTPGTKNDNSNPNVEWLYPSNNTYVNYLVNIVVKINDDTSTIEYAMISIDGINYSMSNGNSQWYYLWDTSANSAKSYNITVFFKDSHNKHYSDTIYNIVVNNTDIINELNSIPVITSANLTNTDGFNRTNGSLVLSWGYIDDDNDAIAYKEILWYVNGNEDSSLRNLTSISSSNLRKNQVWKVSMRVFDGKNWSAFYNSLTLTINNSAPKQSYLFITSSDNKNRKNGTLNCNSNVFDLDSDNTTSFIKWYKNNALIISASSSSILKSGNYSKNDELICESIPSDNLLNGTPMNSTSFKILNSAPILISSIQDKAFSQDKPIVINLITAFMDIDGDELSYAANPVNNINISIDNSKKIATLTPDKGFVGTRGIIFMASDGIDTTNSNEIILTVNPSSSEDKDEVQSISEKTENQEILNKDLKESSDIESNPNESITITGKTIDAEAESKSKKTNYSYFIASVLIALLIGGYFIWRRAQKKRPEL